MQHEYQAYAAATQTVAKTKQVVLLYDGAIRFVQQAKEAIREKRYEDRYHLLMRVSEIIVGLQACLDFENGGDIARILYQYYASLDNRLFTIHRTNGLDECDEIIADLKQMRDVWHHIDQEQAKTGKKTGGPAAAAPQNNAGGSKAGDSSSVTFSA